MPVEPAAGIYNLIGRFLPREVIANVRVDYRGKHRRKCHCHHDSRQKELEHNAISVTSAHAAILPPLKKPRHWGGAIIERIKSRTEHYQCRVP